MKQEDGTNQILRNQATLMLAVSELVKPEIGGDLLLRIKETYKVLPNELAKDLRKEFLSDINVHEECSEDLPKYDDLIMKSPFHRQPVEGVDY